MTPTITSWLGATVVLIAFTLNVRKKVSQTSLVYLLLNILGGVLLAISAFLTKGYAFFFLNIVWGLVAIYTLVTLNKEKVEEK